MAPSLKEKGYARVNLDGQFADDWAGRAVLLYKRGKYRKATAAAGIAAALFAREALLGGMAEATVMESGEETADG